MSRFDWEDGDVVFDWRTRLRLWLKRLARRCIGKN